MSMYGKKRIVIQKNDQIVLAGGDGQGGCWSPVGFIMTMLDGSVRANILKEQYVRSEGFEEIKAPNKKALKEIINKKYNWIKESNG